MYWKKLVVLLLALCLTAAFSACGGEKAPAEVEPIVVTPVPAEVTPDGVQDPTAAPDAQPEPEPEPEPTPEPEPEWEPDWTLLDFTDVEDAVRFVRERYESRWSNDSGDRMRFCSETLTAYDNEGRVRFERTVDSDDYASEFVYSYGVPCYEYEWETYINSTRFRTNEGEGTLREDIYEAATDVLFRTVNSGTDVLFRIDYEYDTKGNLTGEITVVPSAEEDYPVSVKTYTYDSWSGELIREVYEEGAGAGSQTVTEYEYEDGRLCNERTMLIDEYGEKHTTESRYDYNEEGELIRKDETDMEGERSWEYEYDDETGEVSRISYNGYTHYVETLTYTEWGDIKSVRTEYLDDPEADTVEYEYDAECRPVRIVESYEYGASRESRTTTYSYEVAD